MENIRKKTENTKEETYKKEGTGLILRSHIYRKILNGFIACKDIRFF